MGFDKVIEVAVGADMCTAEEAKDFLAEVPEKLPFMATSAAPPGASWPRSCFPGVQGVYLHGHDPHGAHCPAV